jgi:cytochrome c biogenesis protein CcmG, thiol:disulfide interchange protein DsbE
MASRGKLLLAGLLLAAALAFAIFGLAAVHGARAGRRAPALPRESLSGRKLTLAELTARGRPALVVFWASWCGPCAKEAPALERFASSPLGRGRVVGVDWSDSASGARSFIRRYRWTFPNLRDAEGTVGNDYRLVGLPSTYLLDASARIRAVLRCPQDETSLARALASVH